MSSTLLIVCYIIMTYGFSNMVVFGSGPFKIFEYLRSISSRINEHFGSMFSCMMCFPANLGLVLSLINLLWINVPFTPFNLILGGNSGLWWLILIGDCTFTSGATWFIHHIEEWFENNSGEIRYDSDEEMFGK